MLQLLYKLCLTQIIIISSIGLIWCKLIMWVFCCSEVKLLPPELKTSALLFLFLFFNLEFPELFPHLSLQKSELPLFRLSLQKTLILHLVSTENHKTLIHSTQSGVLRVMKILVQKDRKCLQKQQKPTRSDSKLSLLPQTIKRQDQDRLNTPAPPEEGRRLWFNKFHCAQTTYCFLYLLLWDTKPPSSRDVSGRFPWTHKHTRARQWLASCDTRSLQTNSQNVWL